MREFIVVGVVSFMIFCSSEIVWAGGGGEAGAVQEMGSEMGEFSREAEEGDAAKNMENVNAAEEVPGSENLITNETGS